MSPSGRARRRRAAALVLALLPVLLLGSAVRGQPVVVDLSKKLIAITTAFAGTEVLLFGALREPEGRVAVVVMGPEEEVRVRRKTRVGPFWLNTEEVRFRSVPSFYAVATDAPFSALAPAEVLRRLQLGVERLRFEPVAAGARGAEEIARFADALRRAKLRRGLYSERPLAVRRIEDTLFRVALAFPANVPPGRYEVRTLFFRDGRLAYAQSNLLLVSKVGIEAQLFDLAQNRPLLYGLGSLLAAVLAGWTANLLFGGR